MGPNWWKWALGFLLLLAFCDDDEERPPRYCYDFASGDRMCFPEPLPEDKFCYRVSETSVDCFDQPQHNIRP